LPFLTMWNSEEKKYNYSKKYCDYDKRKNHQFLCFLFHNIHQNKTFFVVFFWEILARNFLSNKQPKICGAVTLYLLFLFQENKKRLIFNSKDSSPSVLNDTLSSFRAKRGIFFYQTFPFWAKRFFVSSSTHSEEQEDVIPSLTQNPRLRIKFAMTHYRHSEHFFVSRLDPESKIANQVRNDTLFVIPSIARNLFPSNVPLLC
jgi:hypothetical protein